jgi:ribosomal protein L37AE/L43A
LIDETPPDDQHDNRQNTNPITVRVMKKTLSECGKKITIKRIEMLLCDSNNCIEAFAKGDTSTKVDNTLEKDRVYEIANYEIKNITDSFMRIEFTDLTQFIVSDDETISYNNLVAKINISEVRDRWRAKENISLHPVIITSIGPTRQPLNKFLKEIMLKDDSGKVIMQIWSKENDIDFQFSQGDVVDLYNVIVGKFNANYPKPQLFVIYNRDNSEIISSPLEAKIGMERLLENEDPGEMKPIEMTVQELSGLEVEKHLVIVTAGIEHFAKDEKQMFFVMNCDEVVNHGYLEQEEEKWYCKECGKYRVGKQMLELKATIADDSKVTVQIILYNEAIKVVLGKTNYDDFLTCDRDKRIQILKAVQRQHIDYTFEINHAEFNFVKKVSMKN